MIQISNMWPYHPDLLQRPVPRYTSYPTAAEFREGVSGDDHVAALARLKPGTQASLYVHIPFCKEICWYCGCNTNRSNKASRLQNYLEALEAEVNWLASHVGGKLNVGRISFGGGSPNAIEPLQFVRLFTQILTLFAVNDPEVSVELDARNFTSSWAYILRKVGATRVSLGVQTLEQHIMQAIGRVQPVDMISDATQQLRDNGITSLNFDLMYGLPNQSMADLQRTLDSAIKLGPDRIALFGYAHVPQVIPRQRQIDATNLPDLETRFHMAATGYQQLIDAGYVAIGFDHFAKPTDPLAIAATQGLLRRNFQGYTDDNADALLGLGATSISSLPDIILQNEKNLGRYRMRVMAGQSPITLGTPRTPEDRERALIIEDLLCGRTADLCDVTPHDFDTTLKTFAARGLCVYERNQVTLTQQGTPYARAIAAQFDQYRNQSSGQFSSAV